MTRERIFNFTRYLWEITGAQALTVDVYDDGRMKIWVGEEGRFLGDEERQEIRDVLTGHSLAASQ